MNAGKILTPITNAEIEQLRKSRQIFCDCYLTSTINSLTRTKHGQEILKRNIHHCTDNGTYKIHFPNIKNHPEDIFVTEKELKNLILVDRYTNPIEVETESHPIQKAIEVAINKLIEKHPGFKSLVCNFFSSVEDFEFNFPSKFMSLFTGQKPLVINEKTLWMTLTSKETQVRKLFEEIGTQKDFHLVAGTGFKLKSEFEDWHCYTIDSFNLDNDAISLYNTRNGETINTDMKTFLKSFKYITGYKPEDLK